MILGETEIRRRIDEGDLTVEPFVPDNVEPASIDLRLHTSFTKMYANGPSIDTRDPDSITTNSFDAESITLSPGETVLASTFEHVELPDDLIGQVVGRSSIGRLGIVVHKTAGFIDPGFRGQITLELENESPNPVRLHVGDRICQIWFAEVSGVETPYGAERDSQYQDQSGATASGMQFE